jgi:hypothetical protein
MGLAVQIVASMLMSKHSLGLVVESTQRERRVRGVRKGGLTPSTYLQVSVEPGLWSLNGMSLLATSHKSECRFAA